MTFTNNQTKNRKQRLINFISAYADANTRSPSMKEMHDATGFSLITLKKYLEELQASGLIEAAAGRHRSIRVTRELVSPNTRKSHDSTDDQIPVVEWNSERPTWGKPLDTLPFPREFTHGRSCTLAVSAPKDFPDALIKNNDLVIIESPACAFDGQVVVWSPLGKRIVDQSKESLIDDDTIIGQIISVFRLV